MYSSASAEKPIPENYIGTVTNTSVKDVYILDSVAAVSINVDVPKASAADIKAAFAASAAWDTSGELPVLKDVKILADESRYVPGAAQEPDQTNAPTAAPTDTVEENPGVTTPTAAAPAQVLTELKALADSLPAAEALTEENIDAVLKAKSMLDSLPDALYSQLEPAVDAKISQCYSAIQVTMLEYMVAQVEQLELESLSSHDREAVLRLETIYNGFSEDTREAFSAALSDKLQLAVEKVNQADTGDTTVITQPMSTTEILVVVLLAAIAVIIFAVNITVTVLVLKRKKVLTELEVGNSQ